MQNDSLQDYNLQDNTVCMIIHFVRLQATNENVRNGERTNLKVLRRPYKLLQGTPVESVEGGVKIGGTCLLPVGFPCLSKVLKEGQPPQVYHLPTIGEEVSS